MLLARTLARRQLMPVAAVATWHGQSPRLPCWREQQRQVILRPVAARTLPCLAKKKSKKRSKKQVKLLDPPSWRTKRIEQLRKQLEGGDDEPPELAPTIKPIPTKVKEPICREEFQCEMDRLRDNLLPWIKELYGEAGQRRVIEEIARIKSGRISNLELGRLIRKALDDIQCPIDHRNVERLLRFYKDDDFETHFDQVLNMVVAETLEILKNAVQVPLEDFAPMEMRIDDVLLDQLAPFRQREYFARKAGLFHRLEENLLVPCCGVSMLPTLWDPCYTFGCSISEANVSEIKAGHIVSFVVHYRNGDTKLFGKRVRALAGDEVQYQGKTVVVPDHHFWAVGDNEAKSYDSRDFGAVPLRNLKFRMLVAFTLFPPRIRLL